MSEQTMIFIYGFMSGALVMDIIIILAYALKD